MTFYEVLAVITSYIIGSIPTAFLFGIAKKQTDIRSIGTKNMGALNVYKSVGPLYGLFTYLIDAVKGFFPVFFALHMKFSILCIGLCALMVLCGHNWSLFLKFRGGKGGSTSSGIILALFPNVFLLLLFIFIFLSILTSNVSFGLGFCFLILPFLVHMSSVSSHMFILSFIIPIVTLIRITPYFFDMIKESKGNLSDMIRITIQGFHRYENHKHRNV